MEKVKFLSDYRGVRTNEIFFVKGSVTELPNDPANELVEMGVAKIVIPKPKAKPKLEIKLKPKPKAKAKPKPKKKGK